MKNLMSDKYLKEIIDDVNMNPAPPESNPIELRIVMDNGIQTYEMYNLSEVINTGYFSQQADSVFKNLSGLNFSYNASIRYTKWDYFVDRVKNTYFCLSIKYLLSNNNFCSDKHLFYSFLLMMSFLLMLDCLPTLLSMLLTGCIADTRRCSSRRCRTNTVIFYIRSAICLSQRESCGVQHIDKPACLVDIRPSANRKSL